MYTTNVLKALDQQVISGWFKSSGFQIDVIKYR